MSKEDNVYIKLELNRNSDSGKIDILARFDNKAPNVVVEKNEYFWMPTIEEKDLLNEAFGLLPNSGSSKSYRSESITKSKPSSPQKEPEPKVEEEKTSDIKETIEHAVYKEERPQDHKEKKIEKPTQPEEPAVFKVTREEKEANIEELKDPEEDIKDKEEKDTEDKKVEDAAIVKADSEAIEKALKKHQKKDDDDDSIVEADEKTIIDRVLKQKKKGKWKK